MSNHSTAMRIDSLASARRYAERRVPRGLFTQFDAGSAVKPAVRRNVTAFEDVLIRPRAAVRRTQAQLGTTVAGFPVDLPLLVAPVGALGVAHVDGEAGVARAAGAAGTIQMVSGVTTTPIEEITRAATGPVFYQLYYLGGRDASASVIERVRRAGVQALVLTLDAPVLPRPLPISRRARGFVPQRLDLPDLLRFAPSALTRPSWTLDQVRHGIREPVAAMALRADGTPTPLAEARPSTVLETPRWDDIAWIRRHWDGPLVLKGILTTDDARRAVDHGVEAIVVSNHGGNVLDEVVPTLPQLPGIVAAVDGALDVLVDGGVRTGGDVIKALALGAAAALIGRPYVYGLLAAGEPGVARVLALFREEIEHTLAAAGVGSIHELDRSIVDIPADWWPGGVDRAANPSNTPMKEHDPCE